VLFNIKIVLFDVSYISRSIYNSTVHTVYWINRPLQV